MTYQAFKSTVPLILWCACATVEQASTSAQLAQAQSAFDEGRRLKEAGQYSQAIPHIERALEQRKALLPQAHPLVADCVDLLGVVHVYLADHARAESLLTRALRLREESLGAHHPDVARTLNNLAGLVFAQGNYARAEALSERALKILEATLGARHPDVAESLNNLAVMHHMQGRNTAAEPLFRRALEIWEQTLGENSPEVANTLNNLGQLYTAQGRYMRAEPLIQRALQIREATLGADHPEVALSLQSLAQLYTSQGLYARATPLGERALRIREATLGANHPEVALSLANLAVTYQYQGAFARAEQLHERALQIREATLGADHPEAAHSLTNLAGLYGEQRLYTRAEPLYLRALQIRESSFGENHPTVARTLRQLATLYVDQGLYTRAEPLYERALALQQTTLGTGHPEVASLLSDLATLYAIQGLYARAEPLYERALALQKAALGQHHPDTIFSLQTSALLRFAQRRFDEALPLFQQAFALSEEHLRQEVLGLSEKGLATFLQLFRNQEEQLYSLLRASPGDARVRHLAFSSALLRKGRSLQETATLSRLIHRSLGALDREDFERLQALRTQFATLSLAGPGGLPPAEYQQRLTALTLEGDALATQLARRSEPLRRLQALTPREQLIPRLSQALPPDSALIEFVVYRDRPLAPEACRATPRIPCHSRYLALLLFPDGHTQAVDLGPSEPIDDSALRLHEALARQKASYLHAAQDLYTRVFRPLRPHLGKVERLFLTPDGQLNLVPFAALHDGRRFLIDSFHITYLTSGKELLPRAESIPPASSVVVLADPDFSPAPAPPEAPSAIVHTQRATTLEQLFTLLRSEGADSPWAPLPATREEAQAIRRLLPQARLLLGPEATKQALLETPAPGVLHIATHGFFLEGMVSAPASRAVGSLGAVSAGPRERPEDPLLRSGLVLSRAAPMPAAPTPPRPEDSLVTALELAGLNLWGTQLVVLSACDTGRGDIKVGEGVHGLRRAFMVAGAETLISSLWKVNDETTQQLMERYYHHLLAGLGRTTALTKAMEELRRTHPHPHFWAPFIPLGRDAPLQGLTLPTQAAASP